MNDYLLERFAIYQDRLKHRFEIFNPDNGTALKGFKSRGEALEFLLNNLT